MPALMFQGVMSSLISSLLWLSCSSGQVSKKSAVDLFEPFWFLLHSKYFNLGVTVYSVTSVAPDSLQIKTFKIWPLKVWSSLKKKPTCVFFQLDVVQLSKCQSPAFTENLKKIQINDFLLISAVLLSVNHEEDRYGSCVEIFITVDEII